MNEVYGFKKNIFCYLLAGMLLLAMAFLFSVLWMYVQLDQTRHQNWEQSIAKIFQQRIKEDTKNLEALLCVLGENPLLQQQFLAKNRAALLTLTRELNQRFQRDYQITHFYLHNLDQVNFLRIHQPERFGDLIERVTLQQAAETGKMAAGVELGPLGTLTIRVVMPWYDRENRIGYLELGRELSTLLPSLSHLDLVDGYQLTVNKQYLNRKGWERGMAMLQRPADWDCFSDRVVMVNQLPKGVDPHNLESLGHGGLVDMLRPGETSYMSLSLPLLDALGRQVGQLSVIQNEAEEQQVTIKHICLTMLVLLGLTMLLLILFYRILSRVERRLTHSAEILKESREQLALALEAANLGLWDWRPQSDELYTNDIFLTMLGYAPDAFPQTTERWASLVHPDDFEPTLAMLQRRIDGDDAYYHSEHRLRTADGQWKWILDVGRVVTRNTEGKAERFIGVHIDISERRQMEEVRLETNLLKEQLKRFESLKTMAGAIAHRFNNSMQVVLGNLELLEMTIASSSPERENVCEALQVARKASQIGTMMLTYVGQGTRQLSAVKLVDLARDCIAY
ncbi:PAS domain-containing protein [bacterium]|nr:PAS domain-containing protein [bacterium]